MAKGKARAVSSHTGLEIAGFDYDFSAKFIPVEDPKLAKSKQSKGLLDSFSIRPATAQSRGDIKMRFFSTFTYPTHSELAHTVDDYPQPVQSLNWKGIPYVIAGRYTIRPGRMGPIEATLMLDSPEGDVREQRGYTLLKAAASLAIVSAVFQEDTDAEVNSTAVEFKVSNNFNSGGLPDYEDYIAPNISSLAQKFIPDPRAA